MNIKKWWLIHKIKQKPNSQIMVKSIISLKFDVCMYYTLKGLCDVMKPFKIFHDFTTVKSQIY